MECSFPILQSFFFFFANKRRRSVFHIYYVDHNITFREQFISSVPRVVLLHASFMPSATANHKHCTTNPHMCFLLSTRPCLPFRPRIRNQSDSCCRRDRHRIQAADTKPKRARAAHSIFRFAAQARRRCNFSDLAYKQQARRQIY
jgi:hypothetical protein